MVLPADLVDVVAEVVSQVPRLLALQDRDPDSPMRGCMHPAYWRDKSSDVADMRRQEAALALAWLWRHPLPKNRYVGDPEVLAGCLRALGFWTRMQHKDGTFDEWYKGEHGYATTAFSSYAVSLTVEALGDALADPLRSRVMACLGRCGTWLSTHDDWFKTNHQAVGVAALGAIGRVLEEPAFLEAALRNGREIARRMHDEGWSSEISGLDIGYTFLLSEYLGMHAVLTGERELFPAILKAFRFAASFLHPDLTTGAEYGICGNPYFSRVAVAVLAPHDAVAGGVLQWMERPSERPRDTSATLKDDLRLARYAYQPLLAALLQSGAFPRRDVAGAAPAPAPLAFQQDRRSRWFSGARLQSVSRPAYAAWGAAAHGGLVRIAFRDGDGFARPVVDRGYALAVKKHVFRNARYSLDVEADVRDDELRVTAPFVRCAFVMPPYFARVGLRVATAMPAGHRWSRWLIDQWRRRKGTALNQSSAGVSGGKSPITLERTVRWHDDHVEVVDVLRSRSGQLDPAALFLVLDGPTRIGDQTPDPDRRVPLVAVLGDAPAGPELTLRKEIRPDGISLARI